MLELRNVAKSFAAIIVVLGIVALAARWRTSAEFELRFEEEPPPVIVALDLHRDGTPPPG